MLILALDTSLANCSACVYDSASDQILANEQEFMATGHAEALAPMVARVMKASGKTYADLTRIAVTTGPGTFTGIRIGISFARALALALGIKVLGVDSLTATQAAVSKSYLPSIVTHKAGNSEFFHILNKNISNNIEISNSVDFPPHPTLVIGTAAAALVAQSDRTDLHLSPEHDLPSAAGFVRYAALLPSPTAMPDAIYLREADAKPQSALLRALPDLQIVVADQSAIPLLAKLHATCFDQAWDEPAFASLMQSPGTGALLAHSTEGPVGLLLYRVIADEAEILTIGVDPNLRRRGAGQKMIEALLALKMSKVFLEVASRNEDAIKLYTKAGFKQVGLRKAYYAATGDDALILQWAH
jgi:tRNA threonylcarbamoyl adenosine modification protein YeaZ/ribosomal-protein-alanine acetyltransferase